MKSKTIIRAVSAVSAFLAPVLVYAQTSVVGGVSSKGGGFFGISIGGGGGFGSMGGCASTICTVGMTFLYIINSILVPLLFAVAFITFLYGVAKSYIFSRGNESEISAGHKLILYGIVGFAIMISIWGLVNIVANTFGLSGAVAPNLPTSY